MAYFEVLNLTIQVMKKNYSAKKKKSKGKE